MEFPKNRETLWNREREGDEVVTINATDVVPPFFMSPPAIRSFLEELSTADINFERKAVVETIAGLGPYERDFFDHAHSAVKSIMARHSCIMRMESTRNGDGEGVSSSREPSGSVLTIPITPRTEGDTDLLFPPGTTFKLLLNLGKAIRAGRETSLRSTMRIRSSGSVRSDPGGRLMGTVRFEVVLPDVSFSFHRINDVPVLSTALSIKLARRGVTSPPPGRGSSSRPTHDLACPQLGYLTMNQSRKAIPLLETDHTISTVPMVGVWTAFDDDDDSPARTARKGDHPSGSRSLANPLTWAACVRYIFTEHIKDRATVSDDTFLLVRASHSTCFTYFPHSLPTLPLLSLPTFFPLSAHLS
jgi:hypothetical protein